MGRSEAQGTGSAFEAAGGRISDCIEDTLRNLAMFNKDEVQGKANQLKGRVKQAAGDLTNDATLRDEGEADEVTGQAQEAFGTGKRKVGKAIEDLGKSIKR